MKQSGLLRNSAVAIFRQYKKSFASLANKSLWIVQILVVGANAGSAAAREVEDLALGVALFEYFQQHDFNALSEIQIAEQQGRLPNQYGFANQFAAGIMLSYGMDEAAQEKIERLLVAGDTNNSSRGANKASHRYTPENLARTNYFLAKLLYRKGEHERAYKLLSTVDNALSKELRSEMSFLLHSSFLRGIKGYISEAERSSAILNHENILEVQTEAGGLMKPDAAMKLPSSKKMRLWGDYQDYNDSLVLLQRQRLGSAGTVAGHADTIKRLENLAKQLSESLTQIDRKLQGSDYAELLALRDRALLSIAYLYLLEQKPDQAVRYLRAYSADGVEFDEALLAYGWAELQRKRFGGAVAAWQQLADKDISLATTREALLGIAHVYELQASSSEAVRAYDEAIDKFRRELALLVSLANDDEIVGYPTLIAAMQNNSADWLQDYNSWQLDIQDPHAIKLMARSRQLLGSNAFTILLNQRRDILWLQNHSIRLAGIIQAMDDALGNQRLRFAMVFDDGERLRLQKQFDGYVSTLDSLQDDMKSARSRDYNALMNANEKNSFLRAAKTKGRLAELENAISDLGAEDSAKVREKAREFGASLRRNQAIARLAEGNLVWQVSQTADGRIWTLQKERSQIEVLLSEVEHQLTGLVDMIPAQASQIKGVTRLNTMSERFSKLSRGIDHMQAEVERELQRMLSDEFSAQQRRLKTYLATAQLAKARLLDQQFMDADPLSREKEEIQ